MALNCLYLSLIAVVCCGVQVSSDDLPPFVGLDSMFNQLEDLKIFFSDGFATDAVQMMTAELGQSSVSQPGSCPSHGAIAVQGNMDCVLGYWRAAATSSGLLAYDRWLGARREECDYTIGFTGCLTDYDVVDQIVCVKPTAAVDGNNNTVWAHEIQVGQDTQMIIDLHGRYKVAALSLDVESVPLDFTISLKTKSGPIRDMVRLQQSCENSSSSVCLEYTAMDRKVLTVTWDFETEDDLIADELIITFHGDDQFNSYHTNYYLIREIQLLAMPDESATTTTTTVPTVTRRIAYANGSKSWRQILEEQAWQYEV